MDFMDIIGALALVTAFIYYCSPGMAMILAGSTVRYAPYPYVYNLAGCVLWVVFGGQHHLDTMYWLNIIGALIYAFYILLFLWVVDAADPRRRWLLHYFIPGGAAVLLAGVMLRVFASEAIYGWFCTTVSCLATAAPLWNLRTVHQTKSIDAMPPLVIPAIAFPNGLPWILRNTVNIHPIDRRLVTASGVAAFSALVQIGVHTLFWVRPPPPSPEREPLIPDCEREALQRVEVKDGSDKDKKSNDGSDKDRKSNDGSDEDKKSNDGSDEDNKSNDGSDDDGEKKEKDSEENPDDLRLDVKSLEEKIALTLMLNQEKLVNVKDSSLPHGNPSLLDDLELEEKGRSAVKVPTTSDVPELSSGVVEMSTDPAMSGESRQVSSAVVNEDSESAAAPEQPESEGQVSA